MASLRQFTLQYKTFVKRAARQAMAQALLNHPDPTVTRANIVLNYSFEDFTLPVIVVGFNEQSINNAGVGHFEWLPQLDGAGNFTGTYLEHQHYMYKGAIKFDIYAQSTADLDVVSDAVTEALTMDEVSAPGQALTTRFYVGVQEAAPTGIFHFATLNTDQIIPSGEQAVPPPWRPEDALVYQTGYSLTVFGEFYSYVPLDTGGTGPVEEVDVYAWPSEDGITPLDPTLPAPPVPSEYYTRVTGTPADQEEVPEGPGSD